MKFHEFFQMALEKNMVSNKFNFSIYHDSFVAIAGDEGKLPYEKFPYLLTVIAKKLMPGEKKPIYSLISQFLGDKTVAVDDRSNLAFMPS